MKRNASELDVFSQLSSNNKTLRISSIKGIVKKMKINAKTNHHAVYLICKRLFRGLGGSNPTFRQGCFSSLVGFLKLLPDEFDLNSLEEIIVKELSPAGNNSKLEEGEAYLGQILSYGAMVASHFIFSKSDEEQRAVFDQLFQLSQKRSYLHHVAFVFMTMILIKAQTECLPNGFIDHLKELHTDTLDKLHYLVALTRLSSKTHTIKKVLGTNNFFDVKNGSNLALLIKKNKSEKVLSHEFFKNFVIEAVKHNDFLKEVWKGLCDQKPKVKQLHESSNRKARNSPDLFTLRLAQIVFKQCGEDSIGDIACEMFDENLINIILRNAKKETQLVQCVLSEFNKAAVTAKDDVKLQLIRHILFEEGLLNFDSTVGARTLLSITNSLAFDAVNKLADDYKAILEFKKDIPKKDVESKNKCAIICLNFFTKLINNPKYCEQIKWRLSQLIYLLEMGFFKQPEIKFNREVSQNIQEAFLTSLGHRFPNLDSFHKVIEGLVTHLNKLLMESQYLPTTEFSDDMNNAWKCAITLSKKMNSFIKKNPIHKDIILVIKIILQYMAVMLLKEQTTAVVNIQDLKNIFEELTENKDDCNTIWVEVLVDLFLNLLSKPDQHYRHLIRCTFKFICPHLTLNAFLQVVETLSLSYESDNNYEEDSNAEEEEESNAEEEEEEMCGSSDNEDERKMVSSDGEEEITNNERLRLELHNVLHAGSDNDSVDLDEMDDEEGKRLDEALSNVFRLVKRRRGDKMFKYQNQLAHFRTRVMDLIEICTEVSLPLSYWLKALIPLVDLFGSTIGQSKLDCLRSRITCCLKKLNASKAVPDDTPLTDIVEVLRDLLDKVSKSSGIYVEMKSELIMMLTFLLKASKPFTKGLKPKTVENNEIFQCVRNSLICFFEGKNSIPVHLFIGLIRIGWDGIFPLITEIVNYAFISANKYHKRLSGLQMVEIYVKTPQYFDGHLEKVYTYYLDPINDKFLTCFVNELKSIVNTKEVNNKYHSELWALINLIIVRQNKNQIPVIINSESLKEVLLENFQNLPPMKKKCKNNFKQLCSILKVNCFSNSSENNSSLKQSLEIDQQVSPTSTKKSLERKRKGDRIIKKKKNSKKIKIVQCK